MTTVFSTDVGTELVLACAADISSATALKVIGRSPTRMRVEWAATLEGTDSIKCVIAPGDLSVGEWEFQAYVETTAGNWSGAIVAHSVHRPL